MMLSKKDLLGLRVETKNGRSLGRVVDVYINSDVHEVEQYEVEQNILGGWLGRKLLIHRRQVVRLDEDKMVVEDGDVKQGKLVPALDLET